MKRSIRIIITGLVLVAMVTVALGCKKASPDDAETQAIARQFVEAIFLRMDAAEAMTLVGPIQTYGYVTTKFVEDTITDVKTKKCVTDAASVQTGNPGGDVDIPEVSEADAAKGITERTAWTIASNYKCAADKAPFYRYSVIWLEKVNGKWGVGKASLFFGNPQGY
ncbi:MAG: hypothetical protein ACYCZF_07155 [Anaerolineae bacterium]